jgi:hypothetical protein
MTRARSSPDAYTATTVLPIFFRHFLPPDSAMPIEPPADHV